MRIAPYIVIAVLAACLEEAHTTGASEMIKTLLTIAVGGIAGFYLTAKAFERIIAIQPARRRRSRSHLTPLPTALSEPIMLTPIRRESANDNRGILSLPAPGRKAA